VTDRRQRWLILGASGWFGRTALSMADSQTDVLAIGGRSGVFQPWSQSVVEDFAPTHVFGCAFLTKEKLTLMSAKEYWEINSALIDRFRFAGSLPSCVGVISISSGSVTVDPGHPYSQLKAVEESVTADLVTDERGAVSLRAYSVSGPYVQRIFDYAFSNLLAQGLLGSSPIKVTSSREVWRRYSDVSEALHVCFRLLRPGTYRLIESGGPLVELQELANLIGKELAAQVASREVVNEAPTFYASDNESWEAGCAEIGFSQSDLVHQIRRTLAGCRHRLWLPHAT